MTTETQHPPTEGHRLKKWVHYSLLAGLAASGLLLLAGLVIALVRREARPEGPPEPLPTVIRGALAGDGVACLDLGLLALMLTPVLRVCVLAIGWSLSGERRFAVVAAIVLATLSLSLVLSLG